MLEQIIAIDKQLFYFLNGIHSPLFDVTMSLFTRTEFWLFLFLTIIFCIGRVFGRKALGVFIALALIVLVADQFSGLVKDLVERLRPTHDPSMQDLVHYVVKRGGKYSYFSAHAANTFGVAMFLSLLFKNRTFNVVIFSWAMLASYTRIYLGLHFPGDIITGMIFGLLVGWAVYRLAVYLDRRFFALSSSKVDKTAMAVSQSQVVLLVFVLIICMSFLVGNILLRLGVVTLF